MNLPIVLVLSLPCLLGFNVLSWIQPLGEGTGILDLEDFIVSNNLLPLGSLIYLLFCTSRYGWGFKNFLAEANEGKGIKFPAGLRVYVSFIIPLILLVIFVQAYWNYAYYNKETKSVYVMRRLPDRKEYSRTIWVAPLMEALIIVLIMVGNILVDLGVYAFFTPDIALHSDYLSHLLPF